MKYSYKKEVNMSFEEALDEVTFCLKDQGFGIMTKINVQDSIKNKIGKDMGKYMILGACNPSFAYEALEADYDLGLIMPCNIVVYEKLDRIFVASILPTAGTNFVENTEVDDIAKRVEEKLKLAIDSMEG